MRRVGIVGLAIYALAFASPMAAALFRVWVSQDAVQIGYALSAQSAKKRELGDAARQLEIELAAERAPGRLAALASGLGLVPAPPERIFGTGKRGGSHGP